MPSEFTKTITWSPAAQADVARVLARMCREDPSAVARTPAGVVSESSVIRWGIASAANMPIPWDAMVVAAPPAPEHAPDTGRHVRILPADGERLKSARVAAGLSQQGLTLLLGYKHKRSIQLVETGRAPLSTRMVEWLSGQS